MTFNGEDVGVLDDENGPKKEVVFTRESFLEYIKKNNEKKSDEIISPTPTSALSQEILVSPSSNPTPKSEE